MQRAVRLHKRMELIADRTAGYADLSRGEVSLLDPKLNVLGNLASCAVDAVIYCANVLELEVTRYCITRMLITSISCTTPLVTYLFHYSDRCVRRTSTVPAFQQWGSRR